MCLILKGEVRGKRTFKSKKSGNDVEVVNVLAQIGKGERLVEVANFSGQEIPQGKQSISVVPGVKVSNGRGFQNWATFDGVVKD